MATYSAQFSSVGTVGQGVLIAATASVGTTLHTVPASSTDDVDLSLNNVDTVSILVTIEVAGTSNPVKINVPPQSGMTYVGRFRLAAAQTLKAFAGTTNKVTAYMTVNRVS